MFEKRFKTQQMCQTHDLVPQLLYDEKNKTNSSIQKDRSVFYNIVYKCIQKRILQVRIFRNENTVGGAQAVGLKDSPRKGGWLEENHRSMLNGKTSSSAGAADDNTTTAAATGPGRRQTEGSRGSGAGCRRRKVVFKAAAVVAEADDDAGSLCGLRWWRLGKSSRQRGVACTGSHDKNV
jgi:hypothetical protein